MVRLDVCTLTTRTERCASPQDPYGQMHSGHIVVKVIFMCKKGHSRVHNAQNRFDGLSQWEDGCIEMRFQEGWVR